MIEKTRLFALITLVSASFLNAAPLVFNDRSAFENAVSGETTVTFEGNYNGAWNPFGAGVTFGEVAFNGPTTYGNPYLYVGESALNVYGTSYGLNTGDFLLGEGRGEILMTSLGGGFSALGFDFALAENGFAGTWGFNVSTSNGDLFSGTVPLAQKQFFGVILDSTAASLSFANATNTRPPMLIIDNVTFATGAQSVPDGGATLGFLSLTLLGLIVGRRRSALR